MTITKAGKTNNANAESLVSRVLSEDVISISQAQRDLEKIINQKIDRSTIIRWINKGVAGTRLDGIKIGNQLVTSTQSLTRFVVARSKKLAS